MSTIERTLASKSELARIDEKSLRSQALSLAVQNREPDDTSSGETQVARAKCYMEFLRHTDLS